MIVCGLSTLLGPFSSRGWSVVYSLCASAHWRSDVTSRENLIVWTVTHLGERTLWSQTSVVFWLYSITRKAKRINPERKPGVEPSRRSELCISYLSGISCILVGFQLSWFCLATEWGLSGRESVVGALQTSFFKSQSSQRMARQQICSGWLQIFFVKIVIQKLMCQI